MIFLLLMFSSVLPNYCFSQTKKVGKQSLYDMDIPAFMKDSGAVDTNNEDKKIFLSGRTFVYSYTIKKNNREFEYAVVQEEKARTDSAYKFIDWMLIPVDSLFDNNNIYPIKTVELYVYKSQKDSRPGMTGIKYEYLNNGKRIWLGEGSSITEEASRIFVSSPQSHGFVFTKFDPIPFVQLPLFIGKTWSQFISIPDTFFERAKINYPATDGLAHFNWEYKVTEELNVLTRLGAMSCKKIEAIGKTALGATFATFYFNEQWGFVKTEYRNIDGSELVFQLIKVKDSE